MSFYADSYVGSGVRGDDFRPSAYDDDDGAIGIDFRPDGTSSAGRAIVYSPSALPAKSGRVKISDDVTSKSTALVNAINSRFGVNLSLSSMSLTEILAELLIALARTDGTRWRPLLPSNGVYEIWLKDRIWSQPVVAGGAVGTETFDKANSTTLGPNLTWTETNGDFEVLSNQLHLVTDNDVANDYARCEFDTTVTDMFSQVVLVDSTNYSEMYIIARYAAAAQTFYYAAHYYDGGTGNNTIRKNVAGSESRIGSNIAGLPTANQLVRIECNGSTISSYINGVLSQAVTDTSITTGTRGGLGGFHNLGGNWHMDNFVTGELSYAAVLRRPRRASFPLRTSRLTRRGRSVRPVASDPELPKWQSSTRAVPRRAPIRLIKRRIYPAPFVNSTGSVPSLIYPPQRQPARHLRGLQKRRMHVSQPPYAFVGYVWIKVSGSFVQVPVFVKVSGTFVQKAVDYKSSGTFADLH